MAALRAESEFEGGIWLVVSIELRAFVVTFEITGGCGLRVKMDEKSFDEFVAEELRFSITPWRG